jgi:NADPH-dependent 2,4-dienoyl-CoA reductase/sulfur reductase-like enzyme
MSKVLIVGGNAGGLTAAGRAMRLNPDLDITVLEQGPHIAYSICGAPYYISGDVSHPENLISNTPEEFQRKRGVRIHAGVRAEVVEPARRRIYGREQGSNRELIFEYDRLLMATGYRPVRLDLPGSNLKNIFTLTYLTDAIAIHDAIEARKPQRALLVGGGLVGMEMAESLRKRGLEVTLLQISDQILGSLHPEIAELAEEELERNGVRVLKEVTLETFFGDEQGRVQSARLKGSAQLIPAEIVMVDIGVRPDVSLAEQCGISLGRSGAIAVTPRMETSAAGVYAAGNCAEAIHLVSNQPVFNALGTAANKQGRVAGENIAGLRSVFHGVLNTWVVKIFDLCVARTGLSEREAREAGFRPVAAKIKANSTASYFPGSTSVTIRAIADQASRRLLGLEAAGTDAEKRVDVAAVALTNRMKVDDAAQLDLSYAPPYSQVWDPFLIAMNALLREF